MIQYILIYETIIPVARLGTPYGSNVQGLKSLG